MRLLSIPYQVLCILHVGINKQDNRSVLGLEHDLDDARSVFITVNIFYLLTGDEIDFNDCIL